MRQDIAHEVDTAALPSGIEHLGDGALDAFMRVGEHQLDAAQAATGELAQEGGPERLGFGRADIHAENLAPAVTVDADRDDHCDRDNAPVLAHLHVGGVDPQVGPVALDWTGEEGLHLVIDLRAQAAHLALGDPAHPHRLHQVVHRPRGDALDVGFLHHGGTRLLGHAPRLQETWEVASLAQLGDAQLYRARPGLPGSITIAVALRQPLSALLPIGGASQRANLKLHQAFSGKADHLAQKVGIRALLDQRPQVHDLFGHRWFLESGWRSQPDPTGESSMTTAKPLARYGAMGRARDRLRFRRATPSLGT